MYQRNRLFAQSLSKSPFCLNWIYLIYFHNSFRNDPVRTIIAIMVCEAGALRKQQGASVQLRWYKHVLASSPTRTKGEEGSGSQCWAGEVSPGFSLLAGTKWWRACWSWSSFLWCHWLSVNYNIISPPPPTIIQKFTVTQHFTWANKSTETASCLVSQHGQSIRGHYLYQIEIRGTFLLLNLSLISPILPTPRETNQESRQLEAALKGYYHIDLQKRELLARILSFLCAQAPSLMFIHLADSQENANQRNAGVVQKCAKWIPHGIPGFISSLPSFQGRELCVLRILGRKSSIAGL